MTTYSSVTLESLSGYTCTLPWCKARELALYQRFAQRGFIDGLSVCRCRRELGASKPSSTTSRNARPSRVLQVNMHSLDARNLLIAPIYTLPVTLLPTGSIKLSLDTMSPKGVHVKQVVHRDLVSSSSLCVRCFSSWYYPYVHTDCVTDPNTGPKSSLSRSLSLFETFHRYTRQSDAFKMRFLCMPSTPQQANSPYSSLPVKKK